MQLRSAGPPSPPPPLPPSFFPRVAGKEYSKCDWRYVGRDAYVVSMETFTAFVEGPGCLVLAWTIVGPRVNWRWPVQILVSFGQVGCQ